MATCTNCGDVLTPKAIGAGACAMCGAPIDRPVEPPAGDRLAILPASRPGWGTVRAGLGLIAISMVVLWVSAYLFHDAHQSLKDRSPTTTFQYLCQSLSPISLIVAMFTGLVGALMCIAIPRGSPGRLWMFGTAVCILASFVMFVSVIYMQSSNRVAEESRYPRYAGSFELRQPRERQDLYEESTFELVDKLAKLVGGGSWMLFLMSLWSIAHYVDHRRLKMSIALLMGAAGCFLAYFFYATWSQQPMGFVMQLQLLESKEDLLTTPGVLFTFAISVWYVVTVVAVRHRITLMLRGTH